MPTAAGGGGAIALNGSYPSYGASPAIWDHTALPAI